MSRTQKRDYSGSRGVAASCRNHGGYDYCADNRTHKFQIAEESAEGILDDYLLDDGPEDRCEVEFEKVLTSTGRALHVMIGGRPTWFQRRLVNLVPDSNILVVPRWLAEAKGL